ncbi:MAG: 2'-5' RNA ligase family protein [Leptolyngbyaceae cyanobacterium CRU_2_3]|nr:2'-5' RNA ligase family protein [Leptolyngbyaceae cyanobacterium CRU_2_3]
MVSASRQKHTGQKKLRFFIALIPPLEIQAYADQVIQELSDRYQTSTANVLPHVTLQAPFLWQIETLPQLETCLNQFVQQQPVVPVTLSGFGAFAPHVLYLNVLRTPDLLALQANLTMHLETNLGILDPIAKQRPFTPHVTVASRNLDASTFQQAWIDLETRQIEFEFEAIGLTLLLYDGQRWQIQSQFPLISQIL